MKKGGPVVLIVGLDTVHHIVAVEGTPRWGELSDKLRGEREVGLVFESRQPVLAQTGEVGIKELHCTTALR